MNDAIVSREVHDDGAIVELRLARPPRNVLDGAALDALAAHAAAIASPAHARARAILLTAAGPNFSVGASVPEHARAHAAGMLAKFHGAIRALVACDLPIVAAVRGHCLGGGLELALLATRLVVHPQAQLGQPEIRLGALALGLADAVVDDPDAEAAAWIRAALVPHSASSLRLATRAARAGLRRDLDELLPRLERLYADELSPTHDAEEGVRAFLEKRAPRWEDR